MTTPKKPPKKEAKKFIQSKAYFSSPFATQWGSLPQEDMHFILNNIKDKLTSSGFQKIEVKKPRARTKKGQLKVKGEGKAEDKPEGKAEDKPEGIAEKDVAGMKDGWTDVSVRRQLAIGINEVTKALERNQLQLLLVCKSVKPKHMTEHLIPLSASRDVPACQVPRLSATVSGPLGLKCVLALGFKRPSPGQSLFFEDVIEAITPKVPTLSVPWLQTDSPQTGAEGGAQRGLKRKLQTPENTLQPLKVKKIVPNPAKKRKKSQK